MPDLHSIGLGGGSIVDLSRDPISVGPLSVGCRLTELAETFGGNVLTATDAAIAAGICSDIGNKDWVKSKGEVVAFSDSEIFLGYTLVPRFMER